MCLPGGLSLRKDNLLFPAAIWIARSSPINQLILAETTATGKKGGGDEETRGLALSRIGFSFTSTCFARGGKWGNAFLPQLLSAMNYGIQIWGRSEGVEIWHPRRWIFVLFRRRSLCSSSSLFLTVTWNNNKKKNIFTLELTEVLAHFQSFLLTPHDRSNSAQHWFAQIVDC